MSIDTYDTQAFVRPTASRSYNLAWMEVLARATAGRAGATVVRKRDTIGAPYVSVMRGETELSIYYCDEPHVLDESNEIAEVDEIVVLRGCSSRFELGGTDLALVLVNDHGVICDQLSAIGDFVLYSGQAGLLYPEGEEPP
jgi:hypothetical protein